MSDRYGNAKDQRLVRYRNHKDPHNHQPRPYKNNRIVEERKPDYKYNNYHRDRKELYYTQPVQKVRITTE